MSTTLTRPRKRLALDGLRVETFAPEPELVEEVAAQLTRQNSNCPFTGVDSTCPCCSENFTCPCSFPC